ncbi:acid phosphatase [Sporothrix brasiliensis 5110]|uniref:Acid phosphatase n=1 Tax=Sporothrix brasiliensis 5110 TaxID=1398154 RepID=A0A0C2F458_9PEZI|nr:acid phosphatase [Sporothrix brasiliensis 5110]KIH93674.1 acid phosphatase [Sporothrix brasiliensis 5110]
MPSTLRSGLASSALLLALATAPTSVVADESVLGIYVFHRHGDRTPKSLPPTMLTALGADEVFASGNYFRNRYVSANASSRIANVASDVAVLSQISVTAPVDNVLQSSANVFTQSLYPPAGAAAQQTLANGTVTEPPFGGYQYIPVNIVSSASSAAGSEDSAWLQGNSGCNNAIISSNSYLASARYRETLDSTKAFYAGLAPVINSTFASDQRSFKNAYTIYDYIHVAAIHNASIPSADLLTRDTLLQLQTRADEHEWGLAYNASEPVRAIAGAVLAGEILQALNKTVRAAPAAKAAARLNVQFGAYGTFMSFFGLANLTAASPDFYGIVDYASAMVFEIVTNASVADATAALDPADLSVRFLFSNGSAGLTPGGLTAYPLFGQSELVLPWTTFTAEMNKIAVADTAAWCSACGNTTGVCDPAALGTGSSSGSVTTQGNNNGGGGVSKAVAGVIGALVTLAVILGFEALVMLVGGLRLVKKSVAVAGKSASSA